MQKLIDGSYEHRDPFNPQYEEEQSERRKKRTLSFVDRRNFEEKEQRDKEKFYEALGNSYEATFQH